jgi:N-acetylglucosaminyldiphosphoundecaprenol N-acetyl-beta-D-mannosaminyltransferase
MNEDQIHIGGAPVDPITLDEAVAQVVDAIEAQRPFQHMAINPAKVVRMSEDDGFRDAVLGADLFTADGIGIVWAAQMLGLPLPGRVTGIDLMERLLEISAEKGFRVYFLGAKAEVVERTVNHFTEKYPGLPVAGYRDGYFTAEEAGDVARTIRAARADILLVGISSPKKEAFLGRWREETGVPFCMGVGGSFDVAAGVVQRAPVWMQKAGMEWCYRLIQEPKRMIRRNAVDTPRFLRMIARERIFGLRGARRPVLVVGPWGNTAGGVVTFQKNLAACAPLAEDWDLRPFNIGRPPKKNARNNGAYSALFNDGFARFAKGVAVTAVNFARFPAAAADAEVVQIQSSDYFSFWESMLYATLARQLGRTVVVRFGGGAFKEFYEQSSPQVSAAIRSALLVPDAIVVQSESWKEYFSQFVPAEKINIVPNAVSAPVEPHERSVDGVPTALFIATGEARRKGVEEILAAAPAWRGKLKLVFVAGNDSLREQVREHGLEDMITVHGVVSREELRSRYYAEADLLLLPSHSEGFPNTLLEGMAAGLPVVTCPVGAIPEVVTDGQEAFLVPPRDADALQARTLQLAEDPALRQRMGQAGQALIQEKYLHDVVFPRFDTIWRAALSG